MPKRLGWASPETLSTISSGALGSLPLGREIEQSPAEHRHRYARDVNRLPSAIALPLLTWLASSAMARWLLLSWPVAFNPPGGTRFRACLAQRALGL